MGPIGGRFIRDAHAQHRPIFVWTVNDEDMMRWSIRERVDGVITDDPKRFGEVKKEWDMGRRDVKISAWGWFYIIYIQSIVYTLGFLLRMRYPHSVKKMRREGAIKLES